MTEVEEYFPRGGKKPVAAKYLKQNVNFLGKAEKTAKKKRKPKKTPEGDDGYLSDDVSKELKESVKNCAAGINLQTIKPGVLILCRVRQASETKVYVSLPSRMHGCVMACHISEAYNKLLEAYVNDEIMKVRELPTMFRAGQYVACQVLEVDKEHIMLSMMPQHINGGKAHSDLIRGTIIQAAVSSVEDHGYVMDIGIPNTRAFLPKNNTDSGVELDVGMLSWCTIASTSAEADSAIVTLASDVTSLQKAILKRGDTKGLLPASPVLFTVDKPLDNGIEGHIMDNITSYVKQNHTDTVKGKKPTLGQKIRAYVLYVMPTRKTPMLTMKDIFSPGDIADEQKLADGYIVEDAQVLKVCSKSVIFRLGPGSTGTMAPKVDVHEDLTTEEMLAKRYPVGSIHRLRIIRYNLSDHVYTVTDSPQIINEKYFSLKNLKVGDMVSGTVKSVSESLVKVEVGRLTGVIPHAHMSDAGYCIDARKSTVSKLPKKKFKEGKEVQLRVLCIDPDKNSLVLTAKTSLLSPQLEVLSEYQLAGVGKAYTGVIKFIRSDYLLVGFFNNVTAYVPRNYVTKEENVNIATAFHLGQIVNCTIIKVDVENKKMVGSLTTAPFWPNQRRENTGKRKQSESETQEVPKKKSKPDDNTESTNKANNIQEPKPDDPKTDKKNKAITDEASAEKPQENKNIKKKNKKTKESNSDGKTEPQCIEPEQPKSKTKTKMIENTTIEISTRKTSEESDSIETDIYDDSDNILSPQEMGLIDLTDCETVDDFKKRKFSLTKAIAAKERRIKKIDGKIARIEEEGLTPQNKKFHSAMYAEKLVVEKRIEKLYEALGLAQEKMQETTMKDLEGKKQKKQRPAKVSEADSSSEAEVKLEEKKEEKSKKRKKETVVEDTKVKQQKNETVDINTEVFKVVDSLEPVLDVPSVKSFWTAAETSVNQNVQEDDSSSSEEEDTSQPKKKRKKLSVAEKLAKARAEEELVRSLEQRAAASDAQPRSCEQFERALLARPDASELWIAYMAFHLQATEIDKARAVGRKALNTIAFREEAEKLNVWLALLNVEVRFGTKETQQKTLEDALQTNEPYSIHSKLLEIYLDTGSQQELSSLVDLMMRKYRRNPEAYVACGGACFKAGLTDKARQVMQKAIAVLEKKEHVSVLVQFALLERSHGSAERAEAVFEQVTAVYPARVDVCCAYVDMLLKSGHVDRVRQVLERMTSQKLPARKMKVLYKKWIDVEEKFGDKTNAENIRQRALEYIEKAKF